jgi:hypothetical protein
MDDFLPKMHQQLFRQLQERFSCDLIPSISFCFVLSNSFCVKIVFSAPSAIKVRILSEYLDNPLAAAPLELK